MAEKEITVTYEALFELVRRERDRSDLQKLSETFYDDVLHYVREKIDFIAKLHSETETIKTQNQIDNLKRLMTELHERRERKILDMAINRSRMTKPLDTSLLLAHEIEFYQKVVVLLQLNRKDVLDKVLASGMPGKDFTGLDQSQQITPEQNNPDRRTVLEPPQEQRTKKIIFLHPVPSFVGTNLESYGPFEEQELADLPLDLAHVLITKGRARELP